jgi:hypothetical protein
MKKTLILGMLLAVVLFVTRSSAAAGPLGAERVLLVAKGIVPANEVLEPVRMSLPESQVPDGLLFDAKAAPGDMYCWSSMAACQNGNCAPGQCTYVNCWYPCEDCGGGVCGTMPQCITCPWN